MLYTTNQDVPGIIGILGQTLGENDVNIANFTLGCKIEGGEAAELLYVDGPVQKDVLEKLKKTGVIKKIKALTFGVT